MRLSLVRHAEPHHASNAEGADPALTDEGARQASALGRWFAQASEGAPALIVSSPMRRARETSAYIAQHCSATVRIDDRLAEFDIGASAYVPLEMASQTQLKQVFKPLDTGVWGDHTFDPDLFESRVVEAMNDVIEGAAAEHVAVVCHGGVINSYLGTLLGRRRGAFFRPRYTSISRVMTHGSPPRPYVDSINEVPHAHLLLADL